jgi:dihydrolipoamide dehydrogenase
MLDRMQVPERLVVIGGGVIGLEMASYYREAGASVEVVEMLPKIGGPIEDKLSVILQKALEKSGVKFHLSAKVTRFEANRVVFEKDGAEQKLEADCVLVSIGRRPSAEGLGLECLSIAMERGAVLTDERGRTNVGGVFAAGDINGKSMLAHTAYREAELCVNTMLGVEDRMNYDTIPAVIYTHPEVAVVGLTAETAKQRGIDAEVVELPMRYSGRYVAENPNGNDICIVVADKKTRRLLGVHLCGNYASEIIYGAATMLERGMRVDDIKKVVFPHPTVSEVLREAAFEF